MRPLMTLGLICAATLTAGTGCTPDVCDTEDAHEGNYFIRGAADKADLEGVKCITGSLVVGDLEHREEDTGSGIQGDFSLSAGMVDLDGLEDLEIVEGDVHIAGNLLLLDVSGLRNLTDVGRELRFEKYPRGDLIIHQNPLLRNLDGLDSLYLVGANLIISANDLMNDIAGMASLERVGWEFKVIDNPNLDSDHVRDFAEDVSALGDLVEENNG